MAEKGHRNGLGGGQSPNLGEPGTVPVSADETGSERVGAFEVAAA